MWIVAKNYKIIASGFKTSSHRLDGWLWGPPRLSYKERLDGAQKKDGGYVLSLFTKRKREKRRKIVQGKRGDPLMDFISRNEWS